MKRVLLAILAAGAVLFAGAFRPALAASLEPAARIPVLEKSSVRPGQAVRVKRTSRRAAKQALTAKRRRAIGEGAPLEAKNPGHDADSGTATPPEVLQQLRVVVRAIRNHDGRASDGVSEARLRALALIERRPGVQVSAFARDLGVHQSTASNLLEHLARQGLVEKRRSSEDQRGVSLFATARARTLLQGATGTDAVQQALSRLPASTLAELHQSLAQLIGLVGGTTRA